MLFICSHDPVVIVLSIPNTTRARTCLTLTSHSNRNNSIFSGMLQLQCKFRYFRKMLSVVVCRLSLTRVYRDKTAEARIMLFSLKCSSLPAKFDSEIRRKFEGVPLIGGSNWGGLVFDRVRDAVSRKRCEIELRWQLITNRKSYVGFRLQQISMTLNDLKRQFTALSSVLCVLLPNGWG